MGLLEREVRLLLPARMVDLSAPVRTLAITDVYLLRSSVTVRVRSVRSPEDTAVNLDLKFWTERESLEERVPLSPSQGHNILSAACNTGLQKVMKQRHVFPPVDSLVWELDLYAPPFDFFVIAECEYGSPEPPPQLLHHPEWFKGTDWPRAFLDVTNDVAFFDSMLTGNVAVVKQYIEERLRPLHYTSEWSL